MYITSEIRTTNNQDRVVWIRSLTFLFIIAVMDFMSASHRQNEDAGSVTVCIFVVGIVQLQHGVVVNIRYNTVDGSALGEFSLSLCQYLLSFTVVQKYNNVSCSLLPFVLPVSRSRLLVSLPPLPSLPTTLPHPFLPAFLSPLSLHSLSHTLTLCCPLPLLSLSTLPLPRTPPPLSPPSLSLS